MLCEEEIGRAQGPARCVARGAPAGDELRRLAGWTPAGKRRQAGDKDLSLKDILVSPAEQEELGGDKQELSLGCVQFEVPSTPKGG